MQVMGEIKNVHSSRIAQFQTGSETQYMFGLEAIDGADIIQSMGDNARELEGLCILRDDVAITEEILQIVNQEINTDALSMDVIEKAVRRAMATGVPERVRCAVEDAANAITVVAGGFAIAGTCASVQLGIAMPFICLAGGLMTSGIARKCRERIKDLLDG